MPEQSGNEQQVMSKTAQGTMQLLMARGFFMVSGYIISVILARGLGPVDYGNYGLIMSLLLWLELLGAAGVPRATASLIPRHANNTRSVEQTSTVLLMIISFIIFSFGWILAPSIMQFFGMPSAILLFRIAILDIPVNGLYLAYQGVLNGHRQFGTLSVGIFSYSLTKLAGILILLILGLSVAGALIANICATVGALIYLWVKFPPSGIRPSRPLISPILRGALAIGLYGTVLQILISLDLWSLKSLWSGPERDIGIYVAALNIAKLPMVIPFVLTGVLFASLSWALTHSDERLAQKHIQEAARFTSIILTPCCVLVILHAKPVMTLIYSDVYAEGGTYLRLLVIAYFLFAYLDIYFHALMAAGKSQISAGIILALIPVTITLNLILIPKYGGVGAAGSLAIALCLGMIVATSIAYRRFGSLLRTSTIFRVLLSVGGMMAFDKLISGGGYWLLLKFITMLAVYSLLLNLMKEVTREDLSAFRFWKSEKY